jgi:hypothetical protein
MNFGKWDSTVHESIDQQKRIASARKAECTPLHIDKENCCGQFSGSHGCYNTTLNECTCIDFIRRRLPCKHMYRLAIELQMINLSAETDSRKIKNPPPADSLNLAESVSNIEALSSEAQIALKTFLLEHLYHKKEIVGVMRNDEFSELIDSGILRCVQDPERLLEIFPRNELNKRISALNIDNFKKNMSLKNLIQWCIVNIPDKISSICSDAYVLQLNPIYNKTKRQLYTYLHRKYDNEEYFNGEKIVSYPAGAMFISSINLKYDGSGYKSSNYSGYEFPDDEVTALLNKYNCNRCNKK